MNYDEFKDHFNILSDSRQERKITYNFFEVMFQVVTAMLCGMKTWDEIEAFGEENLESSVLIYQVFQVKIQRLALLD